MRHMNRLFQREKWQFIPFQTVASGQGKSAIFRGFWPTRTLFIFSFVFADTPQHSTCKRFWAKNKAFYVLCVSQKSRIPPQFEKMSALAASVANHDNQLAGSNHRAHIVDLMFYAIYYRDETPRGHLETGSFSCQRNRVPRLLHHAHLLIIVNDRVVSPKLQKFM